MGENVCLRTSVERALGCVEAPESMLQEVRSWGLIDPREAARRVEASSGGELELVGTELNAVTLRRLLSVGKPVILLCSAAQRGEPIGHALVALGYDRDLHGFWVDDPNWLRGRRFLTEAEVDGLGGLFLSTSEDRELSLSLSSSANCWQIYLKETRDSRLSVAMERVAEECGGSPYLRVLVGHQRFAQGRLEEALELWRGSSSPEALMWSAFAALRLGDLDEARRCADDLLEREPCMYRAEGIVLSTLARGRSRFSTTATELARELRDKAPHDANALLTAADALMPAAQDEALECMQEACRYDPPVEAYAVLAARARTAGKRLLGLLAAEEYVARGGENAESLLPGITELRESVRLENVRSSRRSKGTASIPVESAAGRESQER